MSEQASSTQPEKLKGYIGGLIGRVSSLEKAVHGMRAETSKALLSRNKAIQQKIGMRKRIVMLEKEMETLKRDADLHAQLQRAAGTLPGAWSIELVVEKDAGWIDLFDDEGKRVEFDGQGHLSEQVSGALELALEMGVGK